ncbi:MAG TPA: LPS export ABC transporter permease LptF [Methyloceanibacter sp.]|jgi:lipopolysaccharide export system permease protein|nr:LPS export ABC transporter permease LptF [Methyloceanibacter sp.]
MTIFGRYLFRQTANALLVILLTLTLVVWLATALKELNLITSRGQGILLFLQMTMLSLPSLMALIAPNAMLMAALYTLDRMNGDSELIVMTASGAPIWRIGAPLLALASIVAIAVLIANLIVTPASMRALRSFITHVRADLISQVLQPGRFSSPEGGLTFHIRDRSLNGDLLGLLVHDERDDKQVMSYLAERGRIIDNDEGSYLIMLRGYVHRYNNEAEEKDVQIVAFDQNMLDLSEFSPKDSGGKELRPREAYTSDLFSPDLTNAAALRNYPQLRAELHERLATPLYPLVFAFVAIAFLGHARTTREGRWGQILAAFGIAIGLRAAGIAAGNMVALSPWAIGLVYGLPVGAIIIAAWAAHAKMVPQLRSRLSLGAKFQPKTIRFWAGRGMQTT